MLKFLTNLLFIFILFILVSGVPVNTDILEFNPFQPVVEDQEEVPIISTYTLISPEQSSSAVNPSEFAFDITTSDGTIDDSITQQITVKLEGNGIDPIVKRANLINFKDMTSPSIDKKHYEFTLDNLSTNLPTGEYTLTINADPDDTFENPFSGQITRSFSMIDTSKTYIWSSQKEHSSLLTMTLYMPTTDYEYVIPLTRTINYPSNRSRTLYKALHQGPNHDLGLLKTESVIPYASKIYVSNGLASVYIYSPEQEGYEDKFDKVVESITNSLCSLDFIDRVSFYIDNRQESFGGVDLTQTFEPTTQDNVYLGYSHDSDYMMLIPIHLADLSDQSDDQVTLIWDVLTGHNQSYRPSKGIFASIPSDVALNSYTLVDGVLILDVNEAFKDAYNSENEYINLMMDSILYSFTSLDNVDSVEITVDGQVLTEFNGYNLSIPNMANKYINLEP